MIKNMKVRKSLVMGYGITIVVSVIIIITSLVLMTVQKRQYTNILDKYVESNQLVSECRISYNIAARNLRDVFPFPYILTDAQEFIESCLAADEEKQLFRAIEAAGADKKGKKKSAKTEEKVDAFQAGAIQIPESKPTEPVSPAEETAPAPIEAPVETEEIEVEVEEIEVEVDEDENKEG